MTSKRAPKDPEKEQSILKSAIHIFGTVGYHNAKTDLIAQQAGVSKGLVFHYFGSKAQLYVEAVRQTIKTVMEIADYSVWTDAPNLEEMVRRALRYKIRLQVQYPDEFALSIAAYANNVKLPAKQQAQIAQLWGSELQDSVGMLTDPVLERMDLRDEVSHDTVREVFQMMSLLITEKAKSWIKEHPKATIAEMEPLVQQMMDYMDVLEHGFLKK